jgi:hypothetical protein
MHTSIQPQQRAAGALISSLRAILLVPFTMTSARFESKLLHAKRMPQHF